MAWSLKNIVNTTRETFRTDKVIWGIFLIFAAYSILAVYSSTGTLAFSRYDGHTAFFFWKQFKGLAIGIILIIAVQLIPYKYLGRLAQIALFFIIPLLLITLIAGPSINDARRWLTVPFIGFSFQPSEVAKIILIMFTARMLSKRQTVIKDLHKGFLPIIIPAGIIFILVFLANFSTAVMLMTIVGVMMFIGRVNLKHITGLAGVGVLLIMLSLTIGSFFPKVLPRAETWVSRIENFASDDKDTDKNYQVEQAKIAVATGGITGKRPGNSTQRNFLPHPYSDFIFAIIIEEYGILFGAFPIIALYIILLFRGVRIASRSHSKFGAFLAIGISFAIVFQAFINMGVAVNIFPVTGQTLPLISLGDTSLLITCAQFGLLLSISRNNDKFKEQTIKTKP